jgi:hypothetical protein
MEKPRRLLLLTLAAFVLLGNRVTASELPVCFSPAHGKTIEAVLVASGAEPSELLARLVYAESISTGFGDDPLVHQAIAWGVLNRVRLGELSPSMQRTYGRGIRGVVFKKGQFNPAVSEKSRFSAEFLCPRDGERWRLARAAAETALNGRGNPLIVTPWEREHNLSLVVNFYYPQSVQAKGALPPWEGNEALTFVGDVSMGEEVLPASRVRFYRLTHPPADLKRRKLTSFLRILWRVAVCRPAPAAGREPSPRYARDAVAFPLQ